MSIVFLNDQFLAAEEAKVSAFDRGFILADGAYDVATVIGSKLIDLEPHIQRLEGSIKRLEIPFDKKPDFASIIKELVAKNSLAEGMVYIQVTRGAFEKREFAYGGRKSTPTIFAFTQKLDVISPARLKTGISLISTPDIRWHLRDLKSISLLAQVISKNEAEKQGGNEALMIDDGYITECGSSSFAIVDQDSNIVTRKLDNSILPGITRKAMTALASRKGFKIIEKAISLQEALNSKEAMVTSATSLVMPVTKIDNRQIGDGSPGKVTMELRKLYLEFATQ